MMEISNKIPPIQQVPGTTQAKQTSSKAQPAAQGDRVELSSKARELQAAHDTVHRMADVDMDKVADIKARLQAGTYQVDSRKVADAMLSESFLKESH